MVVQAEEAMDGIAALNADNSPNAWVIIIMENILTKSKTTITTIHMLQSNKGAATRKAHTRKKPPHKKEGGER